jgi:hypothetical protein
MYNQIDPLQYVRAGNFELSDIFLTSYRSKDGGSEPLKISIRGIVIELNIFESIFNKTLSGNVVLVDAQNITSQLPMTGFERIEFSLRSPGIGRTFDFTEDSGYPMYIYKVSDRNELSPRSQTYVIHFASKEMIRNEQIRVSDTFTNQISNIIPSIIYDGKGLNTAKDIYVEPSSGVFKYIIPRIKPFDAIDILTRDAISEKFTNAGYYFFETATGFHCKSFENMLAFSQSIGKPALAKFESIPANVRNTVDGSKDIAREMLIIESFKILSQFDTLKNFRNGVYASRLVTHDQLNKQIEEYDFNYFLESGNSFHTELGPDDSKSDINGIMPTTPYIGGKLASDEPEGSLYFKSYTQNTHDNISVPPIDQILQRRLSQRLAFESFRVQIKVHGFTGLSVGDLITLVLPSYGVYDSKDPQDRDPVVSGRYLVSSIRHTVSQIEKKHYMYVECLKDSLNIPFVSENIDTFSNREIKSSNAYDQYSLDDSNVMGTSTDFIKT